MKITTRTDRGVTILALAGALTAGDTTLTAAVRSAIADGADRIVLDLAGLRMMDSSGLGELSRCSGFGATIRLLHVEDKVRSPLEESGLLRMFQVYDSAAAAIASFGR